MKNEKGWWVTSGRLLAASVLLIFAGGVQSAPDIYEKEYLGFTVWLDCDQHHGAVAFYYEIGADTGNAKRKGRFKTDPSVPSECQPNSGRSYRTATVDPATGTWDRGHLVPANHMDGSPDAIKDTFFVTNILPQNSIFNQSKGAWSRTETITECYRDITTLAVWGGVIWGDDASNDFFTQTHGIKTPDYWWKLIYRQDTGAYVAWLFPNHRSARVANIDDYLISIADLKAELEFVPDFGAVEDTEAAAVTPSSSWLVERSGSNLICEGRSTSKS